MITDYVVEIETKPYGRGWEHYYKTEAEAVASYKRHLKDKHCMNVRVYGRRFKAAGGKVTFIQVNQGAK
jgi:hypothetical protein